mgnify:CR=1 FL=1
MWAKNSEHYPLNEIPIIMKYSTINTNGETFYKADTDETFEDISVARAVEIINSEASLRVDPESLKEEDRTTPFLRTVTGNWVINEKGAIKEKSRRFSGPEVEIDRELAVRSIAGLIVEKEWMREPSWFPNGTPDRDLVREFPFRKLLGYRRTHNVLVDVEPYHPLQELLKRSKRGEIETGSDEWKIKYARAFEGYCPDFPFDRAYDYADEFGLDIDFRDEIDRRPLASK